MRVHVSFKNAVHSTAPLSKYLRGVASDVHMRILYSLCSYSILYKALVQVLDKLREIPAVANDPIQHLCR